MKITFSINHDGEVLVLVGGEVQALAKDCEGYEVIKPAQCKDNTMKKKRTLLSKLIGYVAMPFGYVFMCLVVLSAIANGKKWDDIERKIDKVSELLK